MVRDEEKVGVRKFAEPGKARPGVDEYRLFAPAECEGGMADKREFHFPRRRGDRVFFKLVRCPDRKGGHEEGACD